MGLGDAGGEVCCGGKGGGGSRGGASWGVGTRVGAWSGPLGGGFRSIGGGSGSLRSGWVGFSLSCLSVSSRSASCSLSLSSRCWRPSSSRSAGRGLGFSPCCSLISSSVVPVGADFSLNAGAFGESSPQRTSRSRWVMPYPSPQISPSSSQWLQRGDGGVGSRRACRGRVVGGGAVAMRRTLRWVGPSCPGETRWGQFVRAWLRSFGLPFPVA